MNYTEIRKLSLKIFLGFLGLTALVAIISVLSDKFGELQEDILMTCLTISIASIFLMSCAAFIEKKQLVLLGMSGIVLTVSAAVLVIVWVWLEFDSGLYWKVTFTCCILAVAFALAFLLSLPVLGDRYKWVQPVSSVSIGILALQTAGIVWVKIDDSEIYIRLLAAVAIIVALETLAIPLLMKLRKGNIQRRAQLVLEKLEGDIYTDSAGKKYELREINVEQGK
jgi:uncharacterized membrane protein (GlpM family)